MDSRFVRALILPVLACLGARAAQPEISEITVGLALAERTFVSGEPVRGVIEVRNMSQDTIKVDGVMYDDRLFVEVFRANGMDELPRTGDLPFVSRFKVGKNEGQSLETVVSDHFALPDGRYLVRPVLVHSRTRYEGEYRIFEVVPGVVVSRAMQMFANRDGLSRQFEVARTQRRGGEHFFLKARDDGPGGRVWQSTDLGDCLKFSTPAISIKESGEVVVIHRVDRDNYMRTEFWSLPSALEYRGREMLKNPDTAGQDSVQEMYRKSGGVKAAPRPWWKFW